MEIKNRRLEYISFVLPLLLAVICLLSVTLNHHQAFLPIPMPQELVGEYSRDGKNWQPLTEESDISALKGDLYLRGTFLREMGEGWQLNFYRNHKPSSGVPVHTHAAGACGRIQPRRRELAATDGRVGYFCFEG